MLGRVTRHTWIRSLLLLVLYTSGCAHTTSATAAGRSQQASLPPSFTAERVHAAVREIALRLRVSGHVVVRVTVTAAGEMTFVTVRDEVPAGSGLGDAVLALFRENATGWQPALDAQGRPVESTFSLCLRLTVEPDAEQPTTPPPAPEAP